MNKNIYLLGLLFFFSFLSLNAQMFYYYQEEKIKLTVDRNFVHIITDEDWIKFSTISKITHRIRY